MRRSFFHRKSCCGAAVKISPIGDDFSDAFDVRLWSEEDMRVGLDTTGTIGCDNLTTNEPA